MIVLELQNAAPKILLLTLFSREHLMFSFFVFAKR